jgi:hypothetical protein
MESLVMAYHKMILYNSLSFVPKINNNLINRYLIKIKLRKTKKIFKFKSENNFCNLFVFNSII